MPADSGSAALSINDVNTSTPQFSMVYADAICFHIAKKPDAYFEKNTNLLAFKYVLSGNSKLGCDLFSWVQENKNKFSSGDQRRLDRAESVAKLVIMFFEREAIAHPDSITKNDHNAAAIEKYRAAYHAVLASEPTAKSAKTDVLLLELNAKYDECFPALMAEKLREPLAQEQAKQEAAFKAAEAEVDSVVHSEEADVGAKGFDSVLIENYFATEAPSINPGLVTVIPIKHAEESPLPAAVAVSRSMPVLSAGFFGDALASEAAPSRKASDDSTNSGAAVTGRSLPAATHALSESGLLGARESKAKKERPSLTPAETRSLLDMLELG